ncbi:DUF1193 domain containing protein [Asbolus verrucosus]|uniref:DUF1193 domain containing protein n=1 Tax=Asbolus verrucosus TaxID=1661398 RepID=A0A482W573_ASBVE|nr:DUF1193 domain containing protein [Asbolus verrucosus]
MLRKRKLLIISIVLIVTFMVTTNYLLTRLTTASEGDTEIKSIHEKIYKELENLSNKYEIRKPFEDEITDTFIKNINTFTVEGNIKNVWQIANSWVSKTMLVDFMSLHVGSLLLALKKSKIIKADLDGRGTQLKLLLTLEGHQDVIFKPKWYEKETIIEGPVYAGKDRYGSEIVGFYLSAILNMPLTPCSVERNISLTYEIMPVATKRLINTSFIIGNRTCIYGKCFYCKKEDPICEDKNFSLYGAVIFNINASLKSYRSPWQRTYKKNKKAVWEESDTYCKLVLQVLQVSIITTSLSK